MDVFILIVVLFVGDDALTKATPYATRDECQQGGLQALQAYHHKTVSVGGHDQPVLDMQVHCAQFTKGRTA